MQNSKLDNTRLSAIIEFIGFLWKKKQWWLIPIVITLLALGALLSLAQSSPIGPFMYTIF